MRHIAHEGRCFVISACQVQPAADTVLGLPIALQDRPADAAMIRGGSCIVSPFGEVVAGPVHDDEALVTGEVDLDDIVRARYDLDVAGHYARPDVFAHGGQRRVLITARGGGPVTAGQAPRRRRERRPT